MVVHSASTLRCRSAYSITCESFIPTRTARSLTPPLFAQGNSIPRRTSHHHTPTGSTCAHCVNAHTSCQIWCTLPWNPQPAVSKQSPSIPTVEDHVRTPLSYNHRNQKNIQCATALELAKHVNAGETRSNSIAHLHVWEYCSWCEYRNAGCTDSRSDALHSAATPPHPSHATWNVDEGRHGGVRAVERHGQEHG